MNMAACLSAPFRLAYAAPAASASEAALAARASAAAAASLAWRAWTESASSSRWMAAMRVRSWPDIPAEELRDIAIWYRLWTGKPSVTSRPTLGSAGCAGAGSPEPEVGWAAPGPGAGAAVPLAGVGVPLPAAAATPGLDMPASSIRSTGTAAAARSRLPPAFRPIDQTFSYAHTGNPRTRPTEPQFHRPVAAAA
jgi:hypothetical protein